MELEDFSIRLSRLRLSKGVSARDMSLSIGQSENYINHIENCRAFPSMTGFFYICEYLGITPSEFFDSATENPAKLRELTSVAKGMKSEDLELIIAVAKAISKNNTR